MTNTLEISEIAKNLVGQPMFEILELSQEYERQGKKILHFELGEPDFPTPQHICEAAVNAISNGDTNYAPSSGIHDFKKAVIDVTKKSRGFSPQLNQILITPGANSIIFLTIKCLLNPSEEVLIPDPGFPTYPDAIRACGAVPVYVPTYEKNNFELQLSDIEKEVSPKTKLLILNSPSNPTGAVLSEKEIRKIYEFCERKNIYILSDEVYARLIFSSKVFFSPSSIDFCKERVIILNGFSKAFAMTGWRLGVAIGPKEIISKMTLLLSTFVSCVPPFIQRAGVAALCEDQSVIKNMKREYLHRAQKLHDGINSIKGLSCNQPQGAIYVFVNIKKTQYTSEDFAKFLIEECGIATTPGNFFGPHGEGYIRFATVRSLDDINKAISIMKEKINV